MKYEVKVKMVEYGYVTVDANSREEADTNAELAVLEGKCDWQETLITTEEITPVKEKNYEREER